MSKSSPAVGYGQPPEHSRFKKGRSGNPAGRPRKKKSPQRYSVTGPSLYDMVLIEASRPIQIQENGQVVELPMIQAVIRSLGVSAVKGSHRSQITLANLVKSAQDKEYEDRFDLFKTFYEYKRHWEEEFARCDATGVPRPDPVPHPHDIQINHRTMEVIFNGPETPDDKRKWDEGEIRIQQSIKEVAELQNIKEEASDARVREIVEADIEDEKYLLEVIRCTYPSEDIRRKPDFNLSAWRKVKLDRLKVRKKEMSR